MSDDNEEFIEKIIEPITKTKSKRIKSIIVDESPKEDVKQEEKIKNVKPKKQYTMSEKKKEQLALLFEKKKVRDAERKKMKELEAYKAVVENNLLNDVLKNVQNKAKVTKSKKQIIVESSDDDDDDDDDETLTEVEEEVIVVKKPVVKERDSLRSVKNKKSEKMKPVVKVHNTTIQEPKKEVIDYSKFFI